LQILADIFELPITVQKDHEAGCFAAQIMAQKALGMIDSIEDVPQLDEAARTFSYALDEDHWVNGGAVNSGGDVFRWLKDNVL
ncbi:hypothetical protein, partial [Lactococcus petauri]|uniref:hypothetical protein n=1 Tax=Lactococcus petauri TaxID=1940789 RepID=UPI0023EC594E